MRKAEPFITTILGAASPLTTVADFIRKEVFLYNDNLGKVKLLKPGEDTEAHANELMTMIVQNGDASTILLKKTSVPEQVVKGTKFEQLIYTVLSDNRSTGLSALHAEPGIGKSIAAILAIQEQQASGCAGIRVLLAGEFPENVQEFFRVPTPQLVVDVAEILFPLLKAKGIRLRIVFDNTFDRGIATHETSLMGLIRPAFEHGQHIIAITQTKKAAEELAGLNGARTRVAVQQQPEERMYRWSREQARTYLETKELEEVIDKVLNKTEIPDDFGLWKPVDITEYVNTGMKPKAPQRAPGTSAPVWVRQLVKDDTRGFEFAGNAFPIDPVPQNIAYLKKAIKKEKPNKVLCDPDEIDIYIQEDGSWNKQDEEAALERGASKSDCYGFLLP